MRSGVPPDAGKAQESLLEAVVVILVSGRLPQGYLALSRHARSRQKPMLVSSFLLRPTGTGLGVNNLPFNLRASRRKVSNSETT